MGKGRHGGTWGGEGQRRTEESLAAPSQGAAQAEKIARRWRAWRRKMVDRKEQMSPSPKQTPKPMMRCAWEKKKGKPNGARGRQRGERFKSSLDSEAVEGMQAPARVGCWVDPREPAEVLLKGGRRAEADRRLRQLFREQRRPSARPRSRPTLVARRGGRRAMRARDGRRHHARRKPPNQPPNQPGRMPRLGTEMSGARQEIGLPRGRLAAAPLGNLLSSHLRPRHAKVLPDAAQKPLVLGLLHAHLVRQGGRHEGTKGVRRERFRVDASPPPISATAGPGFFGRGLRGGADVSPSL